MPASNLNLTAYWRRKRAAIDAFLKLPPNDPSPGKSDTQTLTAWFHRLTEPGDESSREARVDSAIGTLKQAQEPASGPPDDVNRRSARLVSLVQGAAGSSPASRSYFLGVADAGYPVDIATLQQAVRSAASAAADFLSAAKNEGKDTGGITPVWLALKTLIANNGGIDRVMLDELTGLAAAMESLVPRGGGEDTQPQGWPSNFLSSTTTNSSSSS